MSSSTSQPDNPFEVFLLEPIYLVRNEDDSLAVVVIGMDPNATGRYTCVRFDASKPDGLSHYSFRFRKAITEALLEIRPRPPFILGTREDESSVKSTSKSSRWRTTYIFMDKECEPDVHAWIAKLNRSRA